MPLTFTQLLYSSWCTELDPCFPALNFASKLRPSSARKALIAKSRLLWCLCYIMFKPSFVKSVVFCKYLPRFLPWLACSFLPPLPTVSSSSKLASEKFLGPCLGKTANGWLVPWPCLGCCLSCSKELAWKCKLQMWQRLCIHMPAIDLPGTCFQACSSVTVLSSLSVLFERCFLLESHLNECAFKTIF